MGEISRGTGPSTSAAYKNELPSLTKPDLASTRTCCLFSCPVEWVAQQISPRESRCFLLDTPPRQAQPYRRNARQLLAQ